MRSDESWLESAEVSALYALACADPEAVRALSPAAKVRLLRSRADLTLRPEQQVPAWGWKALGYDGGRGFGKSKGLSTWVNGRVRAGKETLIGCMAPTLERVHLVQFKPLIENAEPDFVPEVIRGALQWPNGVRALAFAPGGHSARGDNLSMCWLAEIVDWDAAPRAEAYNMITTATRIGEARVIWDSTNKGRNEVLSTLRSLNKIDPHVYPIVGGTMFDNPLLSLAYLQDECRKYHGVRKLEEIYGEHFEESEGALWKQAWIDRDRITVAPELEYTLTAVDPATSTYAQADDTGIVHGGRARIGGHAIVLADDTGKHRPEDWGDIVVGRHLAGGRVTVERKKVGDMATMVIRSRAETRGLRVVVIDPKGPWPPIERSVIHIREQNPQDPKEVRASGPAVEAQAGRVHHVGYFPDLEKEQTSWVPGEGRASPNRLDACAYLIAELRDLPRESGPDGSQDIRDAVRAQAYLTQHSRASDPKEARIPAAIQMPLIRPRRLGL